MTQSTPTSHVTESELARLRRRLENLRASLSATEPTRLLEQAATETDARTGDELDLAERTIELEAALRRAALDAKLLEEVEHALAKLDGGTFGISEESGEPIEIERLEAVPWARRTAAEEERQQALDRMQPRRVTA